jgi:Domain of unknown function (DUF6457)
VLNLARVTAQTADRPAAPLTSHFLGVAVGRRQPLAETAAKLQEKARGWQEDTAPERDDDPGGLTGGRGARRQQPGAGPPSGSPDLPPPSRCARYQVDGDVLAAHELGLPGGNPPPGIGAHEPPDRPLGCRCERSLR